MNRLKIRFQIRFLSILKLLRSEKFVLTTYKNNKIESNLRFDENDLDWVITRLQESKLKDKQIKKIREILNNIPK